MIDLTDGDVAELNDRMALQRENARHTDPPEPTGWAREMWQAQERRRLERIAAAEAEQERRRREREAEEERRRVEWESNAPFRAAAKRQLANLEPDLLAAREQLSRLEAQRRDLEREARR